MELRWVEREVKVSFSDCSCIECKKLRMVIVLQYRNKVEIIPGIGGGFTDWKDVPVVEPCAGGE